MDPRTLVAERPMGPLQWVVVFVCAVLNGIDGFDVLTITYAAPGIAEAWRLDKAMVGILISSGFAGMAVGSIVLAPFADRAGRRAALILSLAITAIGMLLSAVATSAMLLGASRFFGGLGIGLLLAVIPTLVAEFANAKRREVALSIMTVGYPLGGIVGGAVAAWLLANYDWRSVFWLGAGLTAAMIPVVFLTLPDSIDFHVARARPDALDRVNRLLRRMGHAPADSLPPPPDKKPAPPLARILQSDMIRTTLTVAGSYFLFITTFYFFIGWLPSLIVDMGFTKSEGAAAAVGVTIGGTIGGMVFGVLSRRIGLKRLLVISMILTWAEISAFDYVPRDLNLIWLTAFVVGFCMMGAIIGYYALMAEVFPTSARATGMGFTVGIGRGGAVAGPIVSGALMSGGFSNGQVGMVMAASALLGAAVIATLPVRPAAA